MIILTFASIVGNAALLIAVTWLAGELYLSRASLRQHRAATSRFIHTTVRMNHYNALDATTPNAYPVTGVNR